MDTLVFLLGSVFLGAFVSLDEVELEGIAVIRIAFLGVGVFLIAMGAPRV